MTSRYFDPVNAKKRERILIKGDKKFCDTVEKLLNDWIYFSYVGRQVLNEIWNSPTGLKVTIQYNMNTWNSFVFDNPDTPEDEESNQFAKGIQYGMKGMDPAKGTGKGASPTLNFDPDTKIPQTFCKGGVCANPRFNLPRFVLFHELIHSMRQMKGLWTNSPLTLNKKQTTLEEGIAILLTNMLMSEKGDNTLRVDHNSIDTVIADPAACAADPAGKKIIEKIKTDHSGLYNSLAGLKNTVFPFNPLSASQP